MIKDQEEKKIFCLRRPHNGFHIRGDKNSQRFGVCVCVCDSAVISGSLQVKIPNSREIRVYDDVAGFS